MLVTVWCGGDEEEVEDGYAEVGCFGISRTRCRCYFERRFVKHDTDHVVLEDKATGDSCCRGPVYCILGISLVAHSADS